MPKILYEQKRFAPDRLRLIGVANSIMEEYAEQGYDLTLRQLYYQFVARDMIANKVTEYDRLGALISDARLAGLIDWEHIVDRTRNVLGNRHWEKPSHILSDMMRSYAVDKWKRQSNYVEVWVEKNALIGVLGGICAELDVRHFACVGYTSQSEMWSAAQRLLKQISDGKQVHIVHLGDHDPSGIDMSRDIKDRLTMFAHGRPIHVQRVALNMAQIERFRPPPNPAKITDSRFASYQEKYGDESWELDALDPKTIVDVTKRAVLQFRDEDLWKASIQEEQRGRLTLEMMREHFMDVVAFLRKKRSATPMTLCRGCGATSEKPYCMCEGRELRPAGALGGIEDVEG